MIRVKEKPEGEAIANKNNHLYAGLNARREKNIEERTGLCVSDK